MSTVIRGTGLTKRFGKFRAVDNISLNIEKGTITGLIGPNGAGKTTTLNAILGLSDFDGELDVMGYDPRTQRSQMMEKVCFISDVGILPRWIKVSDVLDFVEGVHPSFNRKKATELLGETSVPLNKKVKQLSKGMVTQLHLSIVLSIDVSLLVLDEPTIGLDILYRKRFYDHILNDYMDHETSILVTTHQVEEIESLLSHVMFIDKGKIVLDSSMNALAEQFREVLVKPEKIEEAMTMHPVYCKDALGGKRMIFEGVERIKLERLGESCVPSLSDLFIAKLEEA